MEVQEEYATCLGGEYQLIFLEPQRSLGTCTSNLRPRYKEIERGSCSNRKSYGALAQVVEIEAHHTQIQKQFPVSVRVLQETLGQIAFLCE